MEKQKNNLIFISWSIFYILLCVALIVWQGVKMTLSPQLIGISDIYCVLGEQQPDLLQGVQALDAYGKDISKKITVQADIDWNKGGTYNIIYSVKDSLAKPVSKGATLTIVPSYPYFEGLKDMYCLIDNLPDLSDNITAYDGFGKTITNNIEVSVSGDNIANIGTYTVIYRVADDYGFEVTSEISLYVLNDYLPIFYGLKMIEYTIGSGQIDLSENISAFSYKGEDITANIVIDTSGLDLNTAGDYAINISVSDSEDNTRNGQFVVRVNEIAQSLYPKISGIKNYDLFLGDSLPDWAAGVTAYDQTDQDLTDFIEIDASGVNINEIGEYYVFYSVQNSLGLFYNGVSIVRVKQPNVDITSPVFSGIIDIVYYIGDSYPDYLQNVSAIDDFDGDITDNIQVDTHEINYMLPGIYTVKYTIMDSSENTAIEMATVTVIDNKPPEFYNVVPEIEYIIGEPTPNYIDGVTARDDVDGDLTAFIEVFDNNVDYDNPGTYTVVYSVVDSSNNRKEISINIVVQESM